MVDCDTIELTIVAYFCLSEIFFKHKQKRREF